jgi:hypothetical protein
MATLGDIYPRKLDLGRVAERTVWVLGRQPAVIFGLALVLSALPTAYSLYRISQWLDFAAGPFFVFHHGFFWGHSLVSMFLTALLEGCVLAAALGELGGRSPAPREVLTTGLKFLLPLFAVNFLLALGVAAGLFLLVVPGVMLALAWCVAGPALVVERSGITAVFGRSAELTRNNRWRLFGLALIFAVASSIIQSGPGYHHYVGSPFWFDDMVFSPISILVRSVLSSLFHAVAIVALAVIYVELRTLKEGAPPADLDQVFS